jgi:signal peptidase I
MAVEWLVVLGTAAIVAVLLQHFVVQLYEIPSLSMYPTLKKEDRVLVNKLAYSIGGGVERGDVIVFKRPPSERTDDPEQPAQLIKRVIGLPGDVVEARGGVVYIDGKPLEESGDGHYLDPSVITNNLSDPVTVAPGHVFVMGDNRERSHDSRFFGAIPESDIIGRAVVIAWPFNRWSTL